MIVIAQCPRCDADIEVSYLYDRGDRGTPPSSDIDFSHVCRAHDPETEDPFPTGPWTDAEERAFQQSVVDWAAGAEEYYGPDTLDEYDR